MVLRKVREFGVVSTVSVILIVLAWLVLRGGKMHGVAVFGMAAIPVVAARLSKLELKRLVPDMIFGAIDTGLLTVAALVGASTFGIIGAVIGGAVGDAITDAIAGFFEGGIAEWLREKGIDESRTALGSACGKMTGCLAGSGVVLMVASLLGLSVPA
jgi:hypothetical protein